MRPKVCLKKCHLPNKTMPQNVNKHFNRKKTSMPLNEKYNFYLFKSYKKKLN